MNLLDLFSGIGGFHLGLEKAGFKFDKVFNSDIDKYANAVYKYNFKESVNVGSVTDVRGSDFPKINAITFGSPCQDFSIAGSRSGLEGDRSSLVSEAIRLINECRPDFFIWENVKGTFSSNNGEDFWAIIQAFTNIGGYRLEWQLLNTRWFLPQNRERIYLVGCLGEKSKSEVFPIGENGKIYNNGSTRAKSKTKICGAITTGEGSRRESNYVKIREATKKGYSVAEVGDSINYSVPDSKTRRGRVGKKTAQTLDTACNQAVIESGTLRTHNDGKGFRKIKNGDAPAIPARARNDGSGQPIIKDKAKIRRLTPIECERLQGFPDDWTKIGVDGLISDTQRYKMCGNAVTVDVVEKVGENLLKCLK